jgi:hypothetical protein
MIIIMIIIMCQREIPLRDTSVRASYLNGNIMFVKLNYEHNYDLYLIQRHIDQVMFNDNYGLTQINSSSNLNSWVKNRTLFSKYFSST